MSYTEDFKESLRYQVNMLKKQIVNTQQALNEESYEWKQEEKQEWLDQLIVKRDYILDTYPELFI